MKILFIFFFSCSAMFGISQNRLLIEVPEELISRKVELKQPAISIPEIFKPKKPIEFVNGLSLHCYIQLPREAIISIEIFSNSLPAEYSGGFVSPPRKIVIEKE